MSEAKQNLELQNDAVNSFNLEKTKELLNKIKT
jgi:hypothetical protein